MMNPALLSIGAALLWSLFLSDPGHATQTERSQDPRNVIAAEIDGAANEPATQVSTTPTPCTGNGKGRTRAFCGKKSPSGLEQWAASESQYLTTVITNTVITVLSALTLLVTASLALILLAAWARRIRPPQPLEKTGVTPSLPIQRRPRSQWAFRPTLWSTVSASWPSLAWLVGIVSLIWSIWFVWVI
jgi:hypothetical protein